LPHKIRYLRNDVDRLQSELSVCDYVCLYVSVCLCLCPHLCVCVCVCVQLIKEGKRYADLTEVAKLFSLYGADQVDATDTQTTDEHATAA